MEKNTPLKYLSVFVLLFLKTLFMYFFAYFCFCNEILEMNINCVNLTPSANILSLLLWRRRFKSSCC